jgi:ribosome-binding ATPase YchF (GTP1/OBG family)
MELLMCQVGRHHDVKNFVLTCTCIVSPQVMKVEDLKELGSEAAVKAAGKYKQEGKNYVVQDGDIILFKFNVTSSGKK